MFNNLIIKPLGLKFNLLTFMITLNTLIH